MRQALWFLGLGLLGGFAVSAWWTRPTITEPIATELDAAATGWTAARGGARESELAAQVAALQRELETLRSDVDRLVDASESATVAPQAAELDGTITPDAPPAADLPVGTDLPVVRERRFRARTPEARIEALTYAGFSLDRAQHIERRLEELRLEEMQARYDAARRDESSSNAPAEPVLDANAMLRAEIGDAEYERYLDAFGQSTAVNVRSVLASSAAERAGVQRGDQIVAYAGQRIFDVRELNQAVLEGEPGEPVVVDVLREGQRFQVVLPRGPLGISGGARGR